LSVPFPCFALALARVCLRCCCVGRLQVLSVLKVEGYEVRGFKGSRASRALLTGMNLANYAVPVLRWAGIAIPVRSYGYHLGVIENADEDFTLALGLRAARVHFHQQAPEVVWARRRALGFLPSPRKQQRRPCMTPCVVLRLKHKPRNPFLPLPRPGIVSLRTDRTYQPGSRSGNGSLRVMEGSCFTSAPRPLGSKSRW